MDLHKTPGNLIPRPRSGYNVAIAAFVSFGSMSYGYASSVTSALLGQKSWYDAMGLEIGTVHLDSMLGVINGIFALGGAFGCVFNMWSSEYFGRKRSLTIGSAICIVGASLMTGSNGLPMFVVGRLIMGMGIGILVTLVPLYQSEISPPESRGLMVGLHGTFIGASYALAGFVSYGCYFAPYGPLQWRLPLAIQLIPNIILFAGSFYIPYSPRWLISQNRTLEATTTLHRLHGPSSPLAVAELLQMTAQTTHDTQLLTSLNSHFPQAKLAFSQPSFRRRLALGFLVQFGNQCTGSLVIANYFTMMCNRLGIEAPTSILLLAFHLLVTMPGNLINGLFVDRVGRRRFIMIGICGIICCLSGEAAITAQFVQTSSTNKIGLGFGIAFIYFYAAFYSACLDSTMYLIASEIFPTPIRSFGISFSILGQFLATGIFVGIAPTAFANIGYGFWVIFVCLTAIYGLLVFVYLPETKGLTLEDIGLLFNDPVELTFADALEGGMEVVSEAEINVKV